MKLFENEKVISESDNKQIILTNRRIRYYSNTSKNSDFNSIMLDKISSIGLTVHRNILLLILGLITLPIIVGAILLIIYYRNKKHVVLISSDGGTPIMFELEGMKRHMIIDFIDKIEEAAFEIKTKN